MKELNDHELLQQLQKDLETLKAMVGNLQRRIDQQRPIGINPLAPRPPWTPINEYQVCKQCGLKLEGVMGYVCSQPRCPTGLGGAWSANE